MIPELISNRRSVRAFTTDEVAPADVETMVEAACLAPAPHHSRPWRWVCVRDTPARQRLAEEMGHAWRRDLRGDGVPNDRIDDLVAASHHKIDSAPLVLLACVTEDGLDRYPDSARRDAESGMALLSLGAGIQNLLLTATSLGYASCWVAAPIFCREVARDALGLPGDWLPHAMVLVGRPDPSYEARPRPAVEVSKHLAQR